MNAPYNYVLCIMYYVLAPNTFRNVPAVIQKLIRSWVKD